MAMFPIVAYFGILCGLFMCMVQGDGLEGDSGLRAYCQSLQIGRGVCDGDRDKMCKHPKMAWACGRNRKNGNEDKTTANTGPPSRKETTAAQTGTPATSETTTTSTSTLKPTTSRRNRRKHTTRTTQAPVTEKGQPTKTSIGKRFTLSSTQISTIQANCEKKRGGCQGQSKQANQTKTVVKNAIIQEMIKSGKAKNQAEAAKKAQEVLDTVQEAKRALYETQGLNGIEPDDDGLWHKDMRLTLEQAQFMLKEVTGENPAPTKIPTHVKGGRDKRNALFLEYFPTSKWNLPIGYVIGSDLAYDQANQVRAAIAEIERKTCIRFYEDTRNPPAWPYILYTSYSSGSYCGQSPVGNQGSVNNIWLNFRCDGGQIRATIIHETMHSLGVHHEHIRVDRDDWVTVDWNNIDPQSYDLFDGRPYVNSYTTYGIQYDYYSVMHYHAYVANLVAGRPNMIPRYFPGVLTKVIGQRYGMSSKDAEKLRKMYCLNDCRDYHVWCGFWATSNYCLNSQYYDYMRTTCPKSCDFCPEGATT